MAGYECPFQTTNKDHLLHAEEYGTLSKTCVSKLIIDIGYCDVGRTLYLDFHVFMVFIRLQSLTGRSC